MSSMGSVCFSDIFNLRTNLNKIILNHISLIKLIPHRKQNCQVGKFARMALNELNPSYQARDQQEQLLAHISRLK